MIRAVSRRAVAMAPSLATRHDPIEGRPKVILGPCAELDERQPGGGVRHEDAEETIAAARDVGHEFGAGAGQVDDRSRARGAQAELAGLHRREASIGYHPPS